MIAIKNKKGFTLIELLIVIVIIGVLALALLPTILSGPKKARNAADLANLERISTAYAKEAYIDGVTTTKDKVQALNGSTTITTPLASLSSILGGLPQDNEGTNTELKVTPDYVSGNNSYFTVYAKAENSAGNGSCATLDALTDDSDATHEYKASTDISGTDCQYVNIQI